MPLNILVIDDDIEVFETIKSIVSVSTSSIDSYFSFENPESVDFNQYDLIFLELITDDKDIDGIVILRELAKVSFSGQLTIMSGVESSILNTARELAKGHNLNVLPHLNKPFRASDIEDVYDSADNFSNVQKKVLTARKLLSTSEIKSAIDDDRLIVEYQPQVDLISHRVIGVEALARIVGKKEEVYYPEQFIKVAEENQLIILLTKHMIKRALSQFRILIQEGYKLTLSLNVSTHDLQNIGFSDWLEEQANTFEIPPSHIIVEVTESSPLYTLTTALDVLTRLRIKGFKVSIDDFGVGMAVLEQVQRIPATELKIDKAFICDIETNNKSRILVKNTIAMGKELDLDIIAEGIETPQTEEFLVKLGCGIGQGYLYSKPVMFKDLRKLLEIKQTPVSIDTLCQESHITSTETLEVKLPPSKPAEPEKKSLNTFNEQLNQINNIESSQLLTYIIPLTGQYSFIGQSIQLGSRLALNAAFKKIPNLKLGIEFLDDQSDFDFTVKLYEKLPAKTLALVEPAFALCNSKKFLELAQTKDIPVIAPFNGADILRAANAFPVFNLKPSVLDEFKEILNSIKLKDAKKVFFIVKGRFREEILRQTQGISNCIIVEYEPTNIKEAVKQVIEINPGMVVFLGAAKILINLIEQVNNPRVEYFATSLIGTGMVKKLISRSAKVRLTITEPLPDFKSDSEASHAFFHAIEIAKNEFEIDSKFINSMSYESFLIAKLLIRLYRKNNQALSRKKLMSEIESLFGYDLGLDSPLTWTPDSRQLLHKIYSINI